VKIAVYQYKIDNQVVDEDKMVQLAVTRGFVAQTANPVVEAATYLGAWCVKEGHVFKFVGVKDRHLDALKPATALETS
jgi:hypothetical protein